MQIPKEHLQLAGLCPASSPCQESGLLLSGQAFHIPKPPSSFLLPFWPGPALNVTVPSRSSPHHCCAFCLYFLDGPATPESVSSLAAAEPRRWCIAARSQRTRQLADFEATKALFSRLSASSSSLLVAAASSQLLYSPAPRRSARPLSTFMAAFRRGQHRHPVRLHSPLGPFARPVGSGWPTLLLLFVSTCSSLLGPRSADLPSLLEPGTWPARTSSQRH